jgi:hypothetical protein
MIDRSFLFLAGLLFCVFGALRDNAYAQDYPIPAGLTRLTIERADDSLAHIQSLISLNGRRIGNLPTGGRLSTDLQPGLWRVSVRTRPSAEPSVLAVTLLGDTTTRIEVSVDSTRLPQQSGFWALGALLRESLSGPNDDRSPLFVLREVRTESPTATAQR